MAVTQNQYHVSSITGTRGEHFLSRLLHSPVHRNEEKLHSSCRPKVVMSLCWSTKSLTSKRVSLFVRSQNRLSMVVNFKALPNLISETDPQAVSRHPPTAENQLQSHTNPLGIYDQQNDWDSFSPCHCTNAPHSFVLLPRMIHNVSKSQLRYVIKHRILFWDRVQSPACETLLNIWAENRQSECM